MSNTEADFINDILMKNFICQCKIFQDVHEDYKLTIIMTNCGLFIVTKKKGSYKYLEDLKSSFLEENGSILQ